MTIIYIHLIISLNLWSIQSYNVTKNKTHLDDAPVLDSPVVEFSGDAERGCAVHERSAPPRVDVERGVRVCGKLPARIERLTPQYDAIYIYFLKKTRIGEREFQS